MCRKLCEHFLLGYRRRCDGFDHCCNRRSRRRRGGLAGCRVILKKVGTKHFCELGTVTDDVPIAVLSLRRLDESSLIGRIDVWLVRSIPVTTRQPKDITVLDSDLDVIGSGERFRRRVTTQSRERPGKTQPFLKAANQITASLLNRLFPLVRRFRRRIEGQGKLVGAAQRLKKGALDVRRGELVHADD